MNAEVDVKVDRKIGDFFLHHLKDAEQRLWIMSPWIAAEFMELAVNKKAVGVDVRVMTTNDYVADDWVIMGSPNLTQNGMKNSVEGVVVIQSAELATKVGEMVGGLNLKEVPYDAVGRELDKPDIKANIYKRRSRYSQRR